MSAHYFKDDNGLTGVIHLSNIYRFEGYTFEFHNWCGPMLCRKDMEPHARQPGAKSRFWSMLDRWQALTTDQKEETRIYG